MQGKKSNQYTSQAHNRLNSKPPKTGGFRYELLAILIIFLLGIAYSGYRITKSLEFSPAKLFEKAFVESPDSVKDLKGDSKAMVGFDSWIRFNSSTRVTPRNVKEFKPYVAEVARSWFAEKYPDDRVLHQPVSNYEYLLRSSSSVGNIVNEGLLFNKETHDYFYRTWGI